MPNSNSPPAPTGDDNPSPTPQPDAATDNASEPEPATVTLADVAATGAAADDPADAHVIDAYLLDTPLADVPITPRPSPTPDGITQKAFRGKYHPTLHTEWLPFPNLAYDRLLGIGVVTAAVNALPKYVKYLSRPQLKNRTEIFTATPSTTTPTMTKGLFPEKAFLWHGAYPCPEVSNQSRHYANPRYHSEIEYAVTDPDERRDWIATYASLDRDLALIGPHFGVAKEGVGIFCSYKRLSYKTQKLEGRARVGRTFETIHNWGYTYREIAAAFGTSSAAIHRYIQTAHEETPDFEPPDPPTDH